jgi:hypothetical protein
VAPVLFGMRLCKNCATIERTLPAGLALLEKRREMGEIGAIRLASSRVRPFMAERRLGSSSP